MKLGHLNLISMRKIIIEKAIICILDLKIKKEKFMVTAKLRRKTRYLTGRCNILPILVFFNFLYGSYKTHANLIFLERRDMFLAGLMATPYTLGLSLFVISMARYSPYSY